MPKIPRDEPTWTAKLWKYSIPEALYAIIIIPNDSKCSLPWPVHVKKSRLVSHPMYMVIISTGSKCPSPCPPRVEKKLHLVSSSKGPPRKRKEGRRWKRSGGESPLPKPPKASIRLYSAPRDYPRANTLITQHRLRQHLWLTAPYL